jgi:endonuclease/exonuclease/phosphatase family metal-dependent hydrolase
MARSGNRHVAAALGERLGLHWAFAPNYLELTKGPDEEAATPGENEVGLHGVAILSREPLPVLERVPLPECFDMFAFAEKRYGRRTALLAELADDLVVGSAHLEVRGQPGCRARQMRALLDGVERFLADRRLSPRVLLAGDFNSHTFERGTRSRALRGALRLFGLPPGLLHRQLMEPWRGRREPLFDELRRDGYRWEELNDRRATAAEHLARVEETRLLGSLLRALCFERLPLGGRRVGLRLDWFAGRGVVPQPGAAAPCSVGELSPEKIPSDHLPLVLEIPRRAAR